MEKEIDNLLLALWRDLREPDFWWQAGALVLSLLAAWLIYRRVRARSGAEGPAWRLGRGGFRRTLFPLTALVFVLLARAALQRFFNVHLLDVAAYLLVALAVVRAAVYALRHAFSPGGGLATFERIVAGVVWSVFALHIAGWLDPLAAGLEQIGFTVGSQKLNLWLLLQGAALVLVTLLAALWLGGLIEDRLSRAEELDSNLRIVFARLAKALLVLVAILVGLPMVGIDLTTLSVFGGALGVGLGFGLQKVAANYVSGFIILLDRSIRIGNLIEVDRHSGEVTQITTRYTVLRSLTGVEAIVPNEIMMGSVVTNQTFTNTRVRFAVKLQVSYDSDVERAMALMLAVAAGHARVLADPAPKAFLVAFGDSGIDLELGFWIADPEEGTLSVRSDLNLAILHAFRREGIVIPFPQREVRLLGAEAPG